MLKLLFGSDIGVLSLLTIAGALIIPLVVAWFLWKHVRDSK